MFVALQMNMICYLEPEFLARNPQENVIYICSVNSMILLESYLPTLTWTCTCAGEHQQPHFPGLTRGLVAVLLFWDGKRCIANSLRTLIQSRKGRTFTLDLRYFVVLFQSPHCVIKPHYSYYIIITSHIGIYCLRSVFSHSLPTDLFYVFFVTILWLKWEYLAIELLYLKTIIYFLK